MKKDNTVRTIGFVMIFMLAGKVTGLLRDVAVNGYMGTEGLERTAFDPAMTIPSQFLDFALAAALSSSFVPVFNEYLSKRGKEAAFKLADKFITMAVIISAGIAVLCAAFAPAVILGLAGGITDAAAKGLAAGLLRVMMPTIVLTAFAFALTGVLQSLGEFNVPAAMSVLSNLIIIGYFLFLYERFGVWGLCAAFLLGWAAQALVQVPPAAKRGYVYKPSFKFRDEGLREIGRLTIPVVVSTWVVPVNTLVNKRFASGLFGGAGMNALTTANALYSVITGVFILSVANVVFPKLSRLSAEGDRDGFAQTTNATLSAAFFVLLPMSAGLFILSEPITRLVFERGAFTGLSTERVSTALRFCSLGMVGMGWQVILSRAFYAVKDAKTPLLSSVAAIIVNFALSFALTGRFGLAGIAAANAASLTAAGVIMLVRGRKLGIVIKAEQTIKVVFCSALMCSVLMCSVIWFVNMDKAGLPLLFRLLGVVLYGSALYFIVCRLMRVGEAKIVFDDIAARLLRGAFKRGKR